MPKRVRNFHKVGGAGQQKLNVIYRDITTLNLDPANPRLHSKKQIRQIARSIEVFGFNVPVLIDGQCKVIAGHGRLLACRELGWSEVPTLCLDHLTPAQTRAFMIADNRLSEIASWDDGLLAEQLKDLSVLGLDFSLDVVGFEMSEIELRIGTRDDLPAKADAPADAEPEVPSGPRVSKPGDLWLLGKHRVLCGDVLDVAALRKLFDEEQAAMVFTDFAMAASQIARPILPLFLTTGLRHLVGFSDAGALLYICPDWCDIAGLLAAGREAGARLENVCTWVTDVAGTGSLYRNQHELIFVFQAPRGVHPQCSARPFGRNRSNVWHYPGVKSVSRKAEEGNLLALDRKLKPVALVADAILDCTARGDIVLDGFLGGGTTVIAAERTGRRCYGLALDPADVDAIIRRWQAVTHGTARHAANSRSFNELGQEGAER